MDHPQIVLENTCSRVDSPEAAVLPFTSTGEQHPACYLSVKSAGQPGGVWICPEVSKVQVHGSRRGHFNFQQPSHDSAALKQNKTYIIHGPAPRHSLNTAEPHFYFIKIIQIILFVFYY